MNKVLQSAMYVMTNAKDVRIDSINLLKVAEQWSQEGLRIEPWKAPVYPEKTGDETFEMFMVGNVINFAYNDFDNPNNKWTVTYDKVPFPCAGSFGMWASLKRAQEEGYPITNGQYLAQMSRSDAKHIFRGSFQIPLLDERVALLNETGKVLNELYEGSFINLISASEGRCFTNEGKGIVDRLVREFTSYQDTSTYKGQQIIFNKRAQLAPAMIEARALSEGFSMFEDIDQLTVFADYNLPRALEDLGVLKYSDSLKKHIESQQEILKGSPQEVEIRAATIHACDALIDLVNAYSEEKVNALHVDYKLFSHGRAMNKRKESKAMPIHMTRTTAY